MRVLSGIQPSGPLHIGNYFGAIRQFVDLQRSNEVFYFVANYHALTSVRDAAKLRAYTDEVLLSLYAFGVDPEVATVFVQSDVPETAELTWLLTSVTPKSWLEKAVSYKDKVQQGLAADLGLFCYPVLQAADILLYDADVVPVGQDQKQHIEITRNIAVRFNEVYGPVFKVPEPLIVEAVAVVPGLDNRKMSKSYGNTIDLFDTPQAILKKCKKLVTDSRQPEEPGDPALLDSMSLFQLLRLFAEPAEYDDFADRYLRGGLGYGTVKVRLGELIGARFAEARERRADLEAAPGRLAELRALGAERARMAARTVLKRARAACGVE
jgi:tryptophanyl-tRNA synthetase